MAGEIYIADKPTLDSVKVDTTNILNNIPPNKNPIAYVAKAYGSGGDNSQWVTFLDVVGNGELLNAFAYYSNVQNMRNKGLKIEIDGTVVFYVLHPYSNSQGSTQKTDGYCSFENFIFTGGSTYGYVKGIGGINIDLSGNMKPFPTNEPNALDYPVLTGTPKPLKFKSSLKISFIGALDTFTSLQYNYVLY